MVTSFKTIIFIVLLLLLFLFIRSMVKNKFKFTTTMLVATGLGLVLGIIIQAMAKFPEKPTSIPWVAETIKWYGLVGYSFMDLLRMLVVPLIFIAIIRVIVNLKTKNF